MRKVILSILAMLLLVVSYGYLVYYFLPAAERGPFGEMFGAMNTLFSGFALIAIIYTVYIQQKDLEQKSKDIENISKALSQVTEAQKKSVSAQKKQIEILNHTALLQAYSTVLDHFNRGIIEMQGFPIAEEYRKARADYVERLKEVLSEIEQSHK